jgi:hypothetical protein
MYSIQDIVNTEELETPARPFNQEATIVAMGVFFVANLINNSFDSYIT